jgi:hypothetical protein
MSTVFGAAVFLSGCATTQTVVPLAADTIQVAVKAHGECTLEVAKVLATRRIAVETIRRGFDSYIIIGSASRAYSPEQEYTVRLFRKGESRTALDARETLGPEWAKAAAEFRDGSCRL